MTYFYAPISTVVSGVLYPPIISLQRSVTIIIRPLSKPHFVLPKQHSTYNWHLALLCVSVMHTLTRSSITANKVSDTF